MRFSSSARRTGRELKASQVLASDKTLVVMCETAKVAIQEWPCSQGASM